jgi:hypothetical protein
MRALLFFHVLVAMVLVGAVITAAVAGLAARRRDDDRGDLLRELARRASIAALGATLVVVALGEGLAGEEGAGGSWLDVSRGLTVFGLLLGEAALAVVTGLARTRPGLRGIAALTAVLLVVIALATAFVMAAKPS